MSEKPVTYHYDRKGKLPVTSGMAEFKASIQRVARAHDELLRQLFGFVPEKPEEFVVRREDYARVMNSVQQDFGLEEGDPDLVLFVLEQLSRSPFKLKINKLILQISKIHCFIYMGDT